MKMNLQLTPEVLKRFNDKDSRLDHFRSLYEQHEYLTAYARHTDLRMEADPHWAIGRGDQWESHGLLQLKFLISEGLEAGHRFLDVGCGPGRAARRIVPHLDEGHYVGVDISPRCIEYAAELAGQEGWAVRRPTFMLNGDLDLDDEFDFIWAHSVFTHLPPEQIDKMIDNAARILRPHGKFLFTYKAAKTVQRSGLKQFQYPESFFWGVSHGLRVVPLEQIFPANQNTIRLSK